VASGSAPAVKLTYITVSSGETLWGLAADYSKDVSQREWIAEMVELNNLTSNDIQPGQRLALPN
jgi:LysM repeat protein